MESKQELRKRLKAIRNAIPGENRAEKNSRITKQLLSADWYDKADIILVYAAVQSEADLASFCETAWKSGKSLFFPKVLGKEMEFYGIESWSQLAPGAFSVMEPDTEHHNLKLYHNSLQGIILVPGVAFSREGYRIGYGGGYYDRFLAKHDSLYTVGIAFAEQMVDFFAAEPHDCRMKEVVTDREVCCRNDGTVAMGSC